MRETLTIGMRGDDVRALQEQLVELGARIDTDGAYGPVTAAAVRDIQRRFGGLKIDGIAGPLTRAAINAATTPEPVDEATHERALFVDVYRHDTAGDERREWEALARLGVPWIGGVVKATQGLGYDRAWLNRVWPMIRDVGGDRYGDTWIRGAYHYLNFDQDGRRQAEFFVSSIERAGGWGAGDLLPIVDVERGKPTSPNHDNDRKSVVNCTTAFVERIRELLGCGTIAYWNGAARDLNITTRMGCDLIWVPRYTATLPREILTRMGWDVPDMLAWQYATGDGGGVNKLSGFPRFPPGFGEDCQVSAVTLKGGLAELRERALVPDHTIAAVPR